MKNNILITITTLKGSKQYTLSQLFKRFIFFIIGFALVFIVFSIVAISLLSKEVIKQKEKLNLIKQEASILKQKLSKQEEELVVTKQKIKGLKEILGFKGDDIDTNTTFDINELDLIDRKLMLEFIPNGSPIKYVQITSGFGDRINPITKTKEFHTGIDLKANMNTPVRATADGIVEFAAYTKRTGYGRLVIIEHNYGFRTMYGHLNKIVVKRGEFVKKGQVIAYSGNSGMSSGPHLHYEIRYILIALNPYRFMKWNIKNYDFIFKKEKRVRWQYLIQAIKYERLKYQHLLSLSTQKSQVK